MQVGRKRITAIATTIATRIEPQEMRKALLETWEALSIERINREIEKLPHIMAKCISVNGEIILQPEKLTCL